MSVTVLAKVYVETDALTAVVESIRTMGHGRVHGDTVFEVKYPPDEGDHFLHWFTEIGSGGQGSTHRETEAAYGESVLAAIRTADPTAQVIDMRVIVTDFLEWYHWCSERGVWDTERDVWVPHTAEGCK